jgi:hypothetical protein
MILRWLRRQRDARVRVEADAETLMQQFGDAAYQEARTRAIDALRHQSTDEHWTRVRQEIGRRTRRRHVDTATRFLER